MERKIMTPIFQIDTNYDAPTKDIEIIRLGTWNSQGGATDSRQASIDLCCSQQSLDVVCLQDVRMAVPAIQSDNYRWFTSFTSQGGGRVNGFMVSKGLKCEVSPVVINTDLQLLLLKIRSSQLIVMNLYMPCDSDARSFGSYSELMQCITQLKEDYPKTLMVYCGDTNAHLGKDIAVPESRLTGPLLLHEDSNQNGEYLWSVMTEHQLVSCTSLMSSSTMITRHQGNKSSQLDQILIAANDLHLVSGLRGEWKAMSDHKLISCSLRIPAQPGRNKAHPLTNLY